jgi:hypothetical protein
MRTSLVSVFTALATGVITLVPGLARAVEVPSSINAPPTGPGTPSPERPAGRPGELNFREGVEAAAAIGTGFSDTYGLGFQGRAGYTFRDGIYAGGSIQYYMGHSINDQQAHALFLGGEAGYKFFPVESLEVRPYVFAGPAFIQQVAPNVVTSKPGFAVQPGVVGSYHFGSVFVGADAHYMVLPSPNSFALLATGGVGF